MRIRIIDAFTDRPFAGNPAAVCLLDEADTWPDETWMQQVAAEMHLSETAFAHPLTESADADWALRWFTPEVETNLCGHATLATAHAMHRDRGTPGTVRFMSRSGVLVAHTADDGTITLDFPAARLSEAPAPDGLAEALGATAAGHLHDGRTRRPAHRPRRRGGRAGAWPPTSAPSPASPGATASAASSPPRAPALRTPATTSSRASSPPPTASRRTPSPAAPTPPWRRTGRAASAATSSPACRPRPAAASCARRSTAIASTSRATRSSSSTAR